MHACELCFYVLSIGTCSLIYVSTYRTCTYVIVHSEYNYSVNIESSAIQCILLHTLLIHCVHIHAIMYVQLYAYYTIYVGWFHIEGIQLFSFMLYILAHLAYFLLQTCITSASSTGAPRISAVPSTDRMTARIMVFVLEMEPVESAVYKHNPVVQ